MRWRGRLRVLSFFQIITVAKNSRAIMEQESVPVLYFFSERSLAICLVGPR